MYWGGKNISANFLKNAQKIVQLLNIGHAWVPRLQSCSNGEGRSWPCSRLRRNNLIFRMLFLPLHSLTHLHRSLSILAKTHRSYFLQAWLKKTGIFLAFYWDEGQNRNCIFIKSPKEWRMAKIENETYTILRNMTYSYVTLNFKFLIFENLVRVWIVWSYAVIQYQKKCC